MRSRIAANLRKDSLVAVEVLGLVLARITPALQRRYGLPSAEGVVVLRAPDDVNRLRMSNLREGDVLIGLGPGWGDIEPVKDPMEVLDLLAGRGTDRFDHPASYEYEWRCGPNHPTDRGAVRHNALHLSNKDYASVLKALKDPVAWRPD